MEKTLGENIRKTYIENVRLKDEVRALKAQLREMEDEYGRLRVKYHRAVLWGCCSVVRGDLSENTTERCMELMDEYDDWLMI